MVAFIIWAVIGALFIISGIYCFFSKKEKAFGFWANAETFPVKNIKKYNRAVGKLWIAFGVLFIIVGVPLLDGQNSAGSLFSVLGTVFLVLSIMVIYVLGIEPKYRK